MRPSSRSAQCRGQASALRRRWLALWPTVWLLPFACPCQAVLSAQELARVERLLAMISARRDLRLVRNGREHDNETAVTFLRGKLKAMGDDLVSAEQFIDRIATRSSTTGQLYWVRLPDGREMGAGEFLRIELLRLDKVALRN